MDLYQKLQEGFNNSLKSEPNYCLQEFPSEKHSPNLLNQATVRASAAPEALGKSTSENISAHLK